MKTRHNMKLTTAVAAATLLIPACSGLAIPAKLRRNPEPEPQVICINNICQAFQAGKTVTIRPTAAPVVTVNPPPVFTTVFTTVRPQPIAAPPPPQAPPAATKPLISPPVFFTPPAPRPPQPTVAPAPVPAPTPIRKTSLEVIPIPEPTPIRKTSLEVIPVPVIKTSLAVIPVPEPAPTSKTRLEVIPVAKRTATAIPHYPHSGVDKILMNLPNSA
ncbi:hypothetical protein QBC35DRAFT_234692 [Podospora australis]|uniref:Uncharacterized protein n=1 Tax=Podospora australis TaxID=1536484 RepID=A0AAN7AHF2_9PEZI|nr:hypothetical protein QBC35DRAFT_234692 [Podospora australis]